MTSLLSSTSLRGGRSAEMQHEGRRDSWFQGKLDAGGQGEAVVQC